MSEKEVITQILTEEMKRKHDQTNKELDILRRTRAARGGVGAPLPVPAHLAGSAGIIQDPNSIAEYKDVRRREIEAERAKPIDGDDYRTIDDPLSQNAPK